MKTRNPIQQKKELIEEILNIMPNERAEDDPEWVGYNCCLIEIEDLIKSKLEIMKEKKLKLNLQSIEDEVSISDGYHTFDELYDHRITLYIALCKMMSRFGDGSDGYVWYSLLHSDGSNYEGWFILGISDITNNQITYHIPIERIEEVKSFACERDKAPDFDGHTPQDVLERIKKL